MGLFSALTAVVSTSPTAIDGSNQDAVQDSSTTTRSLSIPTVIQLYDGSAKTATLPLRMDGYIDHSVAQLPSYGLKTYQAVTTLPDVGLSFVQEDDDEEEEEDGALALTSAPDLGVWSCAVLPSSSSNSPLTDALLSTIPQTNNEGLLTFVFSADLAQLTSVEPAISKMQHALIRFLVNQDPSTISATNDSLGTTLRKLRQAQFGRAPEDTAPPSTTLETSEGDANADEDAVRINLVINALLPPAANSSQAEQDEPPDDNAPDSYHQRQSIALVIYHLRRYAAALGATLCFVDPSLERQQRPRKTDGPKKQQQQQPALTIPQAAALWRKIAAGEMTNAPEPESPEADDAVPTMLALPPVYGPTLALHQEDLIETVVLRNAAYPGHWDAAKDSLWKVLAPANEAQPGGTTATSGKKSTKRSKSTAASTTSGDQDWLAEIYESIASSDVTAASGGGAATPGSSFRSPPPKSATPATKTPATDGAKTPNDAAVSNFFESLLK
jgi:hypothetical protein